ncbi:MAG TPA: hypothetical protein VFY11_16800 [Nocardioidaceae bacterium]|nr:hypothetical protein [Nocardioidaceae bacterium]
MPDSLREEHVREFTRSAVRSGLLSPQEVYDEVLLAVTSELPFVEAPESVARMWIEEFDDELLLDASTWPEVTDYDRLQAAFEAMEAVDIIVLQGCEDHWAAKDLLDASVDHPPRGIAWFTQPDVWHAIDEGMLEVNVWHANTANVAPGDALLDEVIAVFEAEGLSAHYDEGRIELSAYWQRRPEVTP